MVSRAAFIVPTLMALAACAGGCAKSEMSLMVVTAKPETSSTTYLCNADQSAKSISVHISGRSGAGSVKFQLTDPSGKERWTQAITEGGRFGHDERFGAIKGEWKLKVDQAQFTGDYRARILAK